MNEKLLIKLNRNIELLENLKLKKENIDLQIENLEHKIKNQKATLSKEEQPKA